MRFSYAYAGYTEKINSSLEKFLTVTGFNEDLKSIYFKYREACQKFLDCNDEILVVPHKRVFWSKVISHYEDGTIFYNPKKYQAMTRFSIMGNLAHEAFHHLGYKHAFKYSPDRKYSEAYFLGYWVEYVTKQIENNESYSLNEFINFTMKGIK